MSLCNRTKRVHGFRHQGEHSFACELNWIPITQPKSRRAPVWPRFWCSTCLSADTATSNLWISKTFSFGDHSEVMMNQRGTDRSTPRFFMTWVIELNTKNSTRWGPGGPHLVEFLVFNSAFGRHRHWSRQKDKKKKSATSYITTL